MIQLQLLTGMRPGEVVVMRGCDLNMTGPVWTYLPKSHKTAWHGHSRTIYLGPRAQEIIQPWLKLDTQAYLFSPREALAERNATRSQTRKTYLPAKGARKTTRNRKRAPRDRYSEDTYYKAIARACQRAGVPHWHPNQLRHNAGTTLRSQFGIETARIILGHSGVNATEIYAEADRQQAIDVMKQIG
jgi:integrase